MSTVIDRRLRLASRLDRERGADDSRLAYVDTAAWSIREVLRLDDQHREGALLRHCLYGESEARSNVWSLRYPDNLPHITFAAWRLESPDDAIVEDFDICTFSAGDALVTTHLALSTFEDAHVERLANCAAACADQFVAMPDSVVEWLRQMAAFHGVGFGAW